jgi:phage recombination protein Bet
LCKDINDIELEFFAGICKKTGLDPFIKQIYPIKRGGKLTIQTSIDGYRLIADRTGRYSPGKESKFEYDETGKLRSATAYVKKQSSDGTWHEVPAIAHYDEYCADSNQIWKKMPHVMLAKCAEALALRKAFPAELHGVYTKEEMDQADNGSLPNSPPPNPISEEQYIELSNLLDHCSVEYQNRFNEWLEGNKLNSLQLLPLSKYVSIKELLIKKSQENQNIDVQTTILPKAESFE